jgi:SagB-type dehydrogenase family enzyme
LTRTDLRSPVLRPTELRYQEYRYARTGAKYLAVPLDPPEQMFFDVLGRRQTRRRFTAPLNEAAISALLWYSSKTLATRTEEGGHIWQHRPAPSGGGRHPIDLLVWESDTESPSLYDPIAHSLVEFETSEPSSARELIDRARTLVPFESASVIWFVAQFDRTLSRYEFGESVVWRDAGVLLGILCLIAEALGVSCCPLGMTGEPCISRLLGSDELTTGAGGLLLGRADG